MQFTGNHLKICLFFFFCQTCIQFSVSLYLKTNKKNSLFIAVKLLLPFFQLPLLPGWFLGLQNVSVDLKITANPISASGIALRSLLLTQKKKKNQHK